MNGGIPHGGIQSTAVQGSGDAATPPPSSTTKQIDVSGKIDLPGYEEKGVRWLRIRDPNSAASLYEGPTSATGSFSASVTVPSSLDRLLVEAAAPENPGALGMALAPLGAGTGVHRPTVSSSAVEPKGIPTLIDVDANSTAHVLSLGALARLKRGPTALQSTEEEVLVRNIAAALSAEGTQYCAVHGGTESAPATAVGRPSAPWRDFLPELIARSEVQSALRYDDILRSRGLVAAQQQVTEDVLPSNRFGKGWYWANAEVSQVRTLIRAVAPELSQDGFNDSDEIYVMPYATLRRIVEKVLYHGYGNCRENGMLGAYLASRIANYRQVAVFAVTGERIGPDYEHATALACRKGADAYDIYRWNFDPILPSTHRLNKGLLDADCTVIDPWNGETLPLAAFLDKNPAQGRRVSGLMRIGLPPGSERITLDEALLKALPDGAKALATIASDRGECHFGSPPDTCSKMTIVGGELCGDGIDNDRDGQVDEGCPAQTPETDYVVWKMDNVACWGAPRVYATDRAAFERVQRSCDIPGGGINCNLSVVKTPLRDGFETLARAQGWFCGQITTNWYHYWCNERGPRVETTGGALYTLAIPCDLSKVPFKYP